MAGQVHGSCQCGEVQLTVSLPSKWCAHCYCSMCRKAHGAGCVTWVGFSSEKVDIDSPRGHLAWFASSPGARRGFCTKCGSTMLFESQQWEGETHVTLACLDSPIDRQPQANVYCEHRAEWMPIDHRLRTIDSSS